MNRERYLQECKDKLEVAEYWSKGGDIYRKAGRDIGGESIWVRYEGSSIDIATKFLVGDEHFEARKAHYDGKLIEFQVIEGAEEWWLCNKTPLWEKGIYYRVAKDENSSEEGWKIYTTNAGLGHEESATLLELGDREYLVIDSNLQEQRDDYTLGTLMTFTEEEKKVYLEGVDYDLRKSPLREQKSTQWLYDKFLEQKSLVKTS